MWRILIIFSSDAVSLLICGNSLKLKLGLKPTPTGNISQEGTLILKSFKKKSMGTALARGVFQLVLKIIWKHRNLAIFNKRRLINR